MPRRFLVLALLASLGLTHAYSSAAPLVPAAGVVTGGTLKFCGRGQEIEAIPFTFAGRIQHLGKMYNVSSGSGTVDLTCFYLSDGYEATLTMISPTSKGTFTTSCAGRLALDEVKQAMTQLDSRTFSGGCDPPGQATFHIRVTFDPYGRDLDPNPYDAAYSAVGRYVFRP